MRLYIVISDSCRGVSRTRHRGRASNGGREFTVTSYIVKSWRFSEKRQAIGHIAHRGGAAHRSERLPLSLWIRRPYLTLPKQ